MEHQLREMAEMCAPWLAQILHPRGRSSLAFLLSNVIADEHVRSVQAGTEL
jgi:hypothetical protein